MPSNTMPRDGDKFSEYDSGSLSREKRSYSSAESISTEEVIGHNK